MKRANVVATIGGVLAVGGAAVAWFMFTEARAAEAEVAALLRTAEIELGRPEQDRGGVTTILRQISEHERSAEEPRLVRAAARLQLALGRVQQAWDTESALALEVEPQPEDLALGAQILLQLHAVRGDDADVGRALAYAERHFDASGSFESLFLAWQAAHRAARHKDRQRFAEMTQESFAAEPRARMIEALEANTSDLAKLRALELDIEAPVPVELEFAIAKSLLTGDERSQWDEAVGRLQDVLNRYPSWVDGRSAAALAYHRTGDRSRRDAHLDWLLANARDDDRRRDTWRALLQNPVEGS
ncbi:MAG: hypothetical protein AAF628_00325 [Planctomycetota bacterium]